MNCLEFESQVEVLARGALADARTRAAAEAHVGSCDACAARLADERALSTGLRALAAGMKTAEAPARVEAALLSAFRARAAAAASVNEESSDTAAASNVVPMSGHAPARRWSWAKTIAVASMAAAASLAFFVLVRPEATPSVPPRTAMIEPPPNSNGGGPAAREVAQGGSSEGLREVESEQTLEAESERTPRPAFAPRPRATNVAHNRGGGIPRPASRADARAQEVATDFIPLVQAGPYTQAEEGHLVRVELPRSALASFGLPVNAEAAAGGRVKADVLMGQDGVARAIRFVR
jgi:hypothetical protein